MLMYALGAEQEKKKMSFLNNIWNWVLSLFGKKSSPTPPVTPDTVWTLTSGPLRVLADSRFGGSIYSLTWNGFEFIDSSDHGRELQTAWQLDGAGEGENPTEAGSVADGAGPTSTTVVTGSRVTGTNVLETSARLAYWLPYDGQVLSPDVLSKRVTLGYGGSDNVIHHEISVDLVGDHTNMAVEGLTAYTPQTFTRFFTFDPTTGATTEVPSPSEMVHMNLPVILSTPDGSHAISLWCGDNSKHYVYGHISSWPKLDCAWFFVADAKAGRYSWDCFTIVGTIAEVKDSLTKLSVK